MRVLVYILQVTVLWVAYATALNDTTTESPMVTTSDGSYCPDQWMRDRQRCYRRFTDRRDFSRANASCPENSHLVSISDEEENNFVNRLSGSIDNAWIGFYRQRNVCNNNGLCDWMWTDGSEVGYTNWPPGVARGSPDCANFRASGMWGNDQFCNTTQDFICEQSVWFPTTIPVVTTLMTTKVEPDRRTNMVTANPKMESKEEYVEDDDDDMPIIIGCVVGGLVLVTIIAVVAIILLKRHRTSSQADQPVEDKNEETPSVDKHVRYNPAYEEVETNVTFKPSPGNTDAGAPGNTDTGAHGVGDNPHNIYSEAIKKQDRPGSEGILVKENTLYGYGK